MNAIAIKRLAPDDLPLLLSAGTDVFDNPVDPALAEAFLAHPDTIMVLALDGARVVGMASGMFYFHPDKPREFFVNEVGVAESHQRRGIGKALMAEALAMAGEAGCQYAWLGTEADNVAARALYRATGGAESMIALYEYDLEA